MGLLSKELILKADDLPTRDEEVAEWGGTVRLRTLTGTERDDFEASLIEMKGTEQKPNLRNLRARLVALCIVNEAGVRIFAQQDIAALGKKSALVLDRIFGICQDMNGLSQTDIESLVEDFEDAPNEDSTSD